MTSSETLRAVAIVSNVLLVGAAVFVLKDAGASPDGDGVLILLLLFIAPLTSLAALLKKER